MDDSPAALTHGCHRRHAKVGTESCQACGRMHKLQVRVPGASQEKARLGCLVLACRGALFQAGILRQPLDCLVKWNRTLSPGPSSSVLESLTTPPKHQSATTPSLPDQLLPPTFTISHTDRRQNDSSPLAAHSCDLHRHQHLHRSLAPPSSLLPTRPSFLEQPPPSELSATRAEALSCCPPWGSRRPRSIMMVWNRPLAPKLFRLGLRLMPVPQPSCKRSRIVPKQT